MTDRGWASPLGKGRHSGGILHSQKFFENRGAQFGYLAAQYDFATDGGAVGAINLGQKLPANMIVIDGFVEVLTTLTSAGDLATIALHIESADDIVAAVAISNVGNPWDAGFQDIIPNNTTANLIKTTAERNLTATIAVEAVTAGKFNVFLRYAAIRV